MYSIASAVTCRTLATEEFPIIGFYLYHVTLAGQSSNWTTSGIMQHIVTVGDSFEIGDGRILIYSSIGVQNSIF